MKITYLYKILKDFNFKGLFKTIEKDSLITKLPKIMIFTDMLNCAIRYGAGYTDYDLFEMYNLNPNERDTYITRGRNNKLVKKYNDQRYIHLFENKNEFNRVFNEEINRDWVDVRVSKDSIIEFIKKHNTFFVKPINGSCGKDILKINKYDYSNIEELINKLTNTDVHYILEEVIKQNEEISRIHRESINTLRIVTLLTYDGDSYLNHLNEKIDNSKLKVNVIASFLRIGNNESFVDNFNSNGLLVPINSSTGRLTEIAIDKKKNIYKSHPKTNFIFKGFKIPYYKESIELVKKAALKIKFIGYVGWDIAITPSGPCIVEGNDYPGHDIYQNPIQNKSKVGIMPTIRQYEKVKTY